MLGCGGVVAGAQMIQSPCALLSQIPPQKRSAIEGLKDKILRGTVLAKKILIFSSIIYRFHLKVFVNIIRIICIISDVVADLRQSAPASPTAGVNFTTIIAAFEVIRHSFLLVVNHNDNQQKKKHLKLILTIQIYL